jgi:hypothetical protein
MDDDDDDDDGRHTLNLYYYRTEIRTFHYGVVAFAHYTRDTSSFLANP